MKSPHLWGRCPAGQRGASPKLSWLTRASPATRFLLIICAIFFATITAAHGGEIVEWLVHDGDLVSPGQPLLRLHPQGGY